MTNIFQYFGDVILVSFLQLFVLMGPGLILALSMHLVAGGLDRLATRAIGWKAYYALFSFLGTIIHELGHAFFNLIFGHKILNMKLTNRDPSLGTTAHVAYSYNPRNLYQRIGVFFSAIGPILFGTLIIYLLALLLLGPDEFTSLRNVQSNADMFRSVKGVGDLLGGIAGGAWESLAKIFSAGNLGNWRLWVFLYLVFSIGSNISLSPADLKGAATGFITLVTLVLLLNLITFWMGDFVTRGVQFISQFNGVFYAIMLITLILCSMGALLMGFILVLRRVVGR
jgi:hypothetical protein